MTELQRLFLAYDRHRTTGRACALATVVEVEGSAYRRPGARMLVTEDGQLTGAISGGCLEGNARQCARQALPLTADYAVLQRLLHAPTPYLGLQGPRSKAARLLDDLRVAFPDVEQHLHGRL